MKIPYELDGQPGELDVDVEVWESLSISERVNQIMAHGGKKIPGEVVGLSWTESGGRSYMFLSAYEVKRIV